MISLRVGPPLRAKGRLTPRALLFLTAAAVATVSAVQSGPAAAQSAATVELPEVVVTAPSPVAKPKKAAKKTPAPQQQSAPKPAPASQASTSAEPEPVSPAEETVTPQVLGDQLPGTLLVVDDAFVPVTVTTEREIEATRGSTLTETLQTKPGISGTTFAAGSNRPIIRGLDTYRVRVQENGIGSGDVAALSEDHAVPIDPSAASRVEVVRGPATLRYGSQAIGGVVAVENDRIPSAIPNGGFSGEIRGGISSVDDGRDGSFRATAGANGVAVHADGFKRRADDYDTPRGRQLNTFVDSEGGALGISMVGLSGFLGVSVSRIESLYGIPGEEAVEENKRIDLEQDKVQVRGEWRVQDFGVEALRVWFGGSDYAHREIVEDGEAKALFTNEEYEARVEAQHLPIVTSLGTLRGAIGTQFVSRNIAGLALEDDADDLLAPAENDSIAAFIFEELDVTADLTLQAAARIEHTDVEGSGRLDPLYPAVPLTQLSRNYTPVSVSLGGLYRLPGAHVVSLNGQYVERAPDVGELFSAGAHEATGTFEIGNPDLEIEKATTIEAGLRKATGGFRYDATAYYTQFDGFIFKGLTGVECGETLASCGVEDELDQVLFDQRDATFYGVEISAQYDVAPIWNGLWGIEGQYDFVNAEFEGGGNVPRIPPHRLGGGLYYRDANWFARVGLLHAFDQNRFAADFDEVATPGYTLVSAELSYTARLTGVGGLPQEITIGLKGENLADDEVLNHASFQRREDVLLPGASVRLFGSIKLN
ncbi:MAG: hypothetical protein B7Y80_18600 [Hyphomicrobium sp. 32-62-53]|nr:MAG: hypothetical protein B7Z29_19685 [Hyphomicrobium sp. 12-62-95]OYX97755.1 MAG: hypothetical protein B7Y80_18600 [Hyphomicrobium sp. 32-62-53]